MECTLRDGSYVVDFQFTAQDTAQLVGALAAAGIKWIEVGHGLGLGAQLKHGRAAASDEQYIQAAVETAGDSYVGCFFIPGIGTRDQIQRAKEVGMQFIRIGTNATEIETALNEITWAREAGLNVSANLMKSYVLNPYEICRATRKAAAAGAQVVSLVDSAGGMLPEEVATYVSAMTDTVDAQIGFHGHNNLGLANACAIAALKAGATFIDSTLQGMGRSSGNAITESMVFIYEKLGYTSGVDQLKVLDAGEKLVRPKLGKAGFTGVMVTSGFAFFHSSYMKFVNEACAAFEVDPRELIIEVSKVEKDRPSRELFMETASRLMSSRAMHEVRFPAILNES
jgi:4-hydroxy-2-oxovalerate aldolase